MLLLNDATNMPIKPTDLVRSVSGYIGHVIGIPPRADGRIGVLSEPAAHFPAGDLEPSAIDRLHRILTGCVRWTLPSRLRYVGPAVRDDLDRWKDLLAGTVAAAGTDRDWRVVTPTSTTTTTSPWLSSEWVNDMVASLTTETRSDRRLTISPLTISPPEWEDPLRFATLAGWRRASGATDISGTNYSRGGEPQR